MSDNLLGLRENPFAAGHDSRLVHEHEERSQVVAGFRQALAAGEPFILVTGEAGVGKTSIVTQVLSDEKAWSAFITNPLLTRAELLEEICLRFGVDLPESVSKPRLLAELERHLAEIRREDGAPVLVVDEAHDLSLDLLEELRLLSNLEFKGRPLVQIVLVGLATLEARMSEPDLAQLRQRIATHLRVRPLGGEDTWRYIHHRIAAAGGDGAERFPDETCIEIHKLTRGVPRSINTLAAQALIAASRELERTVTVTHVRASAAGTWLRANVAPASAALPGIPGTLATKPSGERPRPKPVAPPVTAEKTPSAPGSPPKAPPTVKAETPPVDETVSETPAAAPGKSPKPAKAAKPASGSSIKSDSTPKPDKTAAKPPADPPAPPAPPVEAQEHSETLPPRSSGEPEVREWISRFVDPDNPIQIGVHAGADASPFLKVDERELDELSETGGAPTSAPAPNPARKPRLPLPLRPRRGQRDTTWITASAGALVLLAALVVFVPRMKSSGSAPADSAAVATAPVQEPSPTPAQRAARRRAASRASQTAKAAVMDTVAEPPRWQGIEVATYLDPYRASSESARLADATGLSSRVMEASDVDGEAYRVVLGSFGTRKKAERMADDLIRRGLIDQARVVPLGKKAPASE